MKQGSRIISSKRSKKLHLIFLSMILGITLPCLMAIQASAFEIITKEDLVQKIVMKTDFIKTADNFIVLMDTSQSMNHRWQKDSTRSKLDVAKEILTNGADGLPDLGYNAALYEFSPFEVLYPMGPFNKETYMQAINTIKADAEGATFLPRAIRSLEPILDKATGKTVVFIFSDGTYSEIGGMKDPADISRELAEKYNVCFYIIGDGTSLRAQKRLRDMAKSNECSRVISFAKFVENPQYNSGALYVVKTSSEVQTVTEIKIAGATGDNILFDFDSAVVRPEFHTELDKVGDYLQNNLNSYVVLAGFTDSIGDDEYNLGLSRRRAESVATYLMGNYNVEDDRIVTQWFGELNPVADNDTSEGRRLNRRVEIAVGLK